MRLPFRHLDVATMNNIYSIIKKKKKSTYTLSHFQLFKAKLNILLITKYHVGFCAINKHSKRNYVSKNTDNCVHNKLTNDP